MAEAVVLVFTSPQTAADSNVPDRPTITRLRRLCTTPRSSRPLIVRTVWSVVAAFLGEILAGDRNGDLDALLGALSGLSGQSQDRCAILCSTFSVACWRNRRGDGHYLHTCAALPARLKLVWEFLVS